MVAAVQVRLVRSETLALSARVSKRQCARATDRAAECHVTGGVADRPAAVHRDGGAEGVRGGIGEGERAAIEDDPTAADRGGGPMLTVPAVLIVVSPL